MRTKRVKRLKRSVRSHRVINYFIIFIIQFDVSLKKKNITTVTRCSDTIEADTADGLTPIIFIRLE